MPSPEVLSYGLAAALTSVLASAAYSDYRRRMIPNHSVIAVIVLFAAWTAVHGFKGLGVAVLTAIAMLALTVFLYARKVFGAGDAKLFSALALFSGFDHLVGFAMVMALTGGLLAVVGLMLDPARALSARGNTFGEVGRGVPYGIAIAFAGAFTIWAGLLHFMPPIF